MAEVSSSTPVPLKYSYYQSPTALLFFTGAAFLCALGNMAMFALGFTVAECAFGVGFWAFILLVASHCFDLLFGETLLEGSTRGNWATCFAVSGFVIPSLVLACVVVHAFLHAADPWSSLQSWWAGSWHPAVSIADRHVFLCLMGFELRDFMGFVVEVKYVIHHTLAMIVCVLCLSSPAAAGLLVTTMLTTELGSWTLLASVLMPSRATRILYNLGMNLSNVVGLYFFYQYCHMPGIPLFHRVALGTLSVPLIIFRTMAFVPKSWLAVFSREQKPVEVSAKKLE